MSTEGPPTHAPGRDPWHIDAQQPAEPGESGTHEEELVLVGEASPEAKERIETGLDFLGGEMRELTEAAVVSVQHAERFDTEEGRSRFLRLSGKVRARVAMTFAAIALVGALATPQAAEAGERTRKIAYAGAMVAGEIDRELERSYYYAMEDARQIEFALHQMENDADRFMYQHDELSERIARTEDRISEALERGKTDQVRRHMQDKDRMLREQARLESRVERLQGMMRQAEQELMKAEKGAQKQRRIGTAVRVLGQIGHVLSQR